MATKSETKRDFSGGYAGEKLSYKLRYSFGESGGLAADTFILGEVGQKFLVTSSVAHVTTTCVGATAVVTIGVTGNADAIVDATAGAIANLAADFVVQDQAAGVGIIMDSGDQITMDVTTADLTAGEISVYIEGYAVS